MSKFKILVSKANFKDKNNLSQLDLWYALEETEKDKAFNVLLIDGSSKMRDRVELLSLLVAEIMQDRSLNRKSYDAKLTEEGIELKQAEMIKTIGRFIGYFFNSTSWRDNKLQDFDKFELINRLEHIKQHLK